MSTCGFLLLLISVANAQSTAIRVGVAEADITPPVGFPMAGYYHERLAEGTIDPLNAKAIVFVDSSTAAALVVCDLIGIATDLSCEIRQRVESRIGIPASNVVVSATHSHTAPDYTKELWLYLGKQQQEKVRADYIEKLISAPVEAIVMAHKQAKVATLQSGAVLQESPVSFNRRFVIRDGSVRTWANYSQSDVLRAAGPIDPEIGVLLCTNQDASPQFIFSNFALHLDTVGGSKWSADYPYFVHRQIREALGEGVISIFGTGCCGDINHINPNSSDRNTTPKIGSAIGQSIARQLGQLKSIDNPKLCVKSLKVNLPLQDASAEELERSIKILEMARRRETVEFLDHVTAYKKLMLDQFLHPSPFAKTDEHISWGLSRRLAGIGSTLPVEVTVIALGTDLAIVCLPGEVFVDLGLAIKQASPFRNTMVVELSNAVETIYVPHRAAYAGGSYEVTNSALEPGGGEMLVEASVRLLRDAAGQILKQR